MKDIESLIEMSILQGLTKKEITSIQKDGKKLVTPKKFDQISDKIIKKWIEFDTPWFTRSHIARIQYSKQLLTQISRINKYLTDPELTTSEKVNIEKVLMIIHKELFASESSIDPDQYYTDLELSFTRSKPPIGDESDLK